MIWHVFQVEMMDLKRIIINNATVNDILKDRVKSSGYIDYTKSLLNVIGE